MPNSEINEKAPKYNDVNGEKLNKLTHALTELTGILIEWIETE